MDWLINLVFILGIICVLAGMVQLSAPIALVCGGGCLVVFAVALTNNQNASTDKESES